MKHTSRAKGFTLIELLVVIAIIAILAVAVILTLNPAELLKQSRDSTRLSDMATLKSAISLYLSDVSTPNLDLRGGTTSSTVTCYLSYTAVASTTCVAMGFSTSTNAVSSTAGIAVPTDANGAGWIPINFSLISSGLPIGNLPLDPVNNTTYFYAYMASSTTNTFKLVSKMESVKYSTNGSSDVESGDGGYSSAYYETGTGIGL